MDLEKTSFSIGFRNLDNITTDTVGCGILCWVCLDLYWLCMLKLW